MSLQLYLNVDQLSTSASSTPVASVRSLLADTGQFLATLLVGPKAAAVAAARSRYHKASHLAIHRILYIIFSYIENSEVCCPQLYYRF